ncbi:MAG: hypothetical protein M1292_01185 [Bacteroidetes bacterium]|nr:hypothetical protein [Bacteroidota bacterium]
MKNIGLYLENVHGTVPQSKIDSFRQQVEAANLSQGRSCQPFTAPKNRQRQ